MNFKADIIKFKSAMLEKGWGYRELGESANIASVTITKALQGGKLNSKSCNKIATALDKPVTELFVVE